jgi:hypothetical protein
MGGRVAKRGQVDGWDFSRWKGGVGGLLAGRMGGVGGKGRGSSGYLQIREMLAVMEMV